MNTERPHELVTEAELRTRPPAERRRFVPVPEAAAAELERMSEADRGRWLESHPADALRLARAHEKRARRAAGAPSASRGPIPGEDLSERALRLARIDSMVADRLEPLTVAIDHAPLETRQG